MFIEQCVTIIVIEKNHVHFFLIIQINTTATDTPISTGGTMQMTSVQDVLLKHDIVF